MKRGRVAIIVIGVFVCLGVYRLAGIMEPGTTYTDTRHYFSGANMLKKIIDWKIEHKTPKQYRKGVLPEHFFEDLKAELAQNEVPSGRPFGWGKTLYTILITTILYLCGNLFPSVFYVEALLGVAGVIIFYFICRLICGNIPICLGVTSIFCLSGLAIANSHNGSPQGFAYFFYMGFLYIYVYYLRYFIDIKEISKSETPRMRFETFFLYTAGILLGAAFLCHPVVAYYSIILMLVLPVVAIFNKEWTLWMKPVFVILLGFASVVVAVAYSVMFFRTGMMRNDLSWLFGNVPIMTNFEQLLAHFTPALDFGIAWNMEWFVKFLINGENVFNVFYWLIGICLCFAFFNRENWRILRLLASISLAMFIIITVGNIYLVPRTILFMVPFFYLTIMAMLVIVKEKWGLRYSIALLMISVAMQLWQVKPFVFDETPYVEICEWMEENGQDGILANHNHAAGMIGLHGKAGYRLARDSEGEGFFINSQRYGVKREKIRDLKFMLIKDKSWNMDKLAVKYGPVIKGNMVYEVEYVEPLLCLKRRFYYLARGFLSDGSSLAKKIDSYLEKQITKYQVYPVRAEIVNGLPVKNYEYAGKEF